MLVGGLLLIIACLIPSRGHAEDLDKMLSRYARHPRAALSWRIATAYRARGHIGKAMNWGEQAIVSPGLSSSVQQKVQAMRNDLRWDLCDAGYGIFKLTVSPSNSEVRIDGQSMLLQRSFYQLWLPEGSHELSVSAKDYAPISLIISASRGEQRRARVTLKLSRRPELRLKVRPPNSEVWVNNRFLGYATQRVFRLNTGPQLVELRAHGFDSFVKTYVMRSGERHLLIQQLHKTVVERMHFQMASGVERKLTPLELANHGERHRHMGRSKVNNPSLAKHLGSSEITDDIDDERPNRPPEDAEVEFDEEAFDQMSTGEIARGDDSPPMRDKLFKGLLWTGIGLGVVGGGLGTALYGVSRARAANGMQIGSKTYDGQYDDAARVALIGYGAAGLGGVATVIGGFYLFDRQGLSRTGKGLLLSGLGLVTGGLGTYLMRDAVFEAEAANNLKIGSANYDPNFDGAENLWRAGAITAGAGATLLLSGAWLLLIHGGANTSTDLTAQSGWRSPRISPQLSPGRVGTALTFKW